MSALARALVAAQAEFPTIERTKNVRVTSQKTGASYTFAYAPLEAIFSAVKPGLAKHGLAVSQLLATVDGRPALRSVLLHESGEKLEDVCPLPTHDDMSAQELGSLVTYFRRYALVALLGIATEEDDDGNVASGNAAHSNGRSDLPVVPEDARPSEYVIHFGKNRGTLLSSLTPAQLRWYANEWQVQEEPSDYDLRLKAAAVALNVGDDSPMNSVPRDMADVPFA